MITLQRGLTCCALVLLTSLLLGKPLSAQDAPPASQNPAIEEGAPAENPPARVARISYLKGDVSFLPAGQNQWSQATLNFVLTTGDRIYAHKGARAELEGGIYTIRLADAADLAIINLNDQTVQLGFGQGTLRVSVYQLPSGNAIEVDTPNGALTVLGPGHYRFDRDPHGDRTRASVNSGSLQVNGGGVSQTVEAGQAVELRGADPVEVSSIPIPGPDNFDKWSADRDERLASSISTRYVSPFIPGYSDLDTYGRWVDVPDYGPVWYPTVPVGWVPYRYGHWAWIDPWGWTWMEDEPWGFCPFHYGRWVFVGVGWGWLPGPLVVLPVFTPALVAFLGGPFFSIGVGFVAWFPLGPGEPFFPWYHHTVAHLRLVNITNIRNVTNITNIINVTNISNIHYAYRTVATTVVPAHIFNSGQPVAHHIVKVPPEQLSRAQVIPHPLVNPTMRAAAPGKPVPAPPVRPVRLAASTGARYPAPVSTVNRPPERGPASLPPPTVRTQPVPRSVPGGLPRAAPPLIVRSTPPPPIVPFAQRRPAMLEHPGRPLEPIQIQNIRLGRPVGPMLDKEFPPHFAPVVPARPAHRPAAPVRPH